MVLRIYCPNCKKFVVPEWDLDWEDDWDAGWGYDGECLNWIPICPYCGLALTKPVIEAVKEEELEKQMKKVIK